MTKIILHILHDKGSFSRLLVASFARTDVKLSFFSFQMNRIRERGAFAGADAHVLTVDVRIVFTSQFVLMTWEFRDPMIRPCLHGAMKEK